MKKSLSLRAAYAGAGAAYVILAGCFLALLFSRSEDPAVRGAAVSFAVLGFLPGLLLLFLVRRRLAVFAEELGGCIDGMVNGERDVEFDLESDTLTSKLNDKLKRLYEILLRNNERIRAEKQAIQEMISDVSHQVKTPVANLRLYHSTLTERRLPREKEREFLSLMGTQIDKLNFLTQAMIRASRLETGAIALKEEPAPLFETVAQALGGIVLSAGNKKIEVSVSCDPDLTVPHDRKWTAEALFNILDNAVKYTPPGGRISVAAERWETVTKIEISDTGRGIPERHHAQIFKRFYREEDVRDIPGAGLGLYLCREIVARQGGYIQVKSEPGKGSAFSVFLPNESAKRPSAEP